jgi:hypothetical protein
MCKNEMSDTNQQRHRDDLGAGQPDTVKRLWMANTADEIQAILTEYTRPLLYENINLRARIAELEQPEPTTVLGWLQRLPDGYRERAIGQCDPEFVPTAEPICIQDAISSFAEWMYTNEKDEFWNDVFFHYYQGKPLPPLPI